jgi:arsenite methyltransferase
VPDRMARIMKSWRAHCAHANLPRSLAHRLESVGFRLDGASVFPILNLSWDDDAYSKGLAELIRNFVATRGDVPAEEPGKWLDEFPELHQGGQYFFSSNRYIFHASKAA